MMATKYEIGYKKPPRATQFKPGQSGNSKGRPKGSKTLGSVIEKAFGEGVTLKDGKNITKLEAAAKQLANGAAQGDLKKIQLGMDLLSKFRDISAAEKFAIKFMKDGYITPEDAEKYVRGHVDKPGISYKPIYIGTIQKFLLFASMEWLVTIAKIDSIFDLYDMSTKIVAAILTEGSFWDAFDTTCKLAGIDEKKKNQLIKKLEKTRDYKRPSIELVLNALNLYSQIRNFYKIHIKIIRDVRAKNPEYRVAESMHIDNVIKNMLENIDKDGLTAEELVFINNYEKSFSTNYKDFMNNDFEMVQQIPCESKQSMDELFAWFNNE